MGFQELFIAASAAAIATSIGALIAIPIHKIGRGWHSAMLAFSAGLMAFSAMEMFGQSHSAAGDVGAIAGFLSGIMLLFIAEKLLPHAHLWIRKKELIPEKRKAALLFGTITIHNVPEGFAIASAFAGATPLGWLVTAAIAIQDVPEGFLVSSPMACYGSAPSKCIKYGVLSGVVEFAAAILGFVFLSYITILIPPALAFASGAMAYVVFVELLPDAFRRGLERTAALSFLVGAGLGFGLATLLAF